MKNVVFSALAAADPNTLEEVSLVQVSRGATNWQASKKCMMFVSARAVASQTDVVNRKALNVPSVTIKQHGMSKQNIDFIILVIPSVLYIC